MYSIPLFIVLGGVILLQVFASRKQEKKRRALLNSVKKYDKVVTLDAAQIALLRRL